MWWNNGTGWSGMGGGGWVVMTVVMAAFLALVVVGVVVLGRNGRPSVSDSGTTPGSSAQKVLDERFARGEIDAEEYHARRAVLNSAQATLTRADRD